MDEGEKVNVRSPQQQNEAHNPSRATAKSDSTVTINISENNLILVVIVVILLAIVVIGGIYLLRTQVLPNSPLAGLFSSSKAEQPVPADDENIQEAIPAAASGENAQTGTQSNQNPAATSTPQYPTATPTIQPFAPDGGEQSGREGREGDKAITPSPPKDQILRGNIVVCVPPHLAGKARIHLARLSVDRVHWDSVEPYGIPSELRSDGTVKIDGLPIDPTSWGRKGQPYRLQLLDGEWKSIGEDKGFVVRPNDDNRAPNTFCQS